MGEGRNYKYQAKTTTFWLASDIKKSTHKKNLLPFGWSAIYEITDNLKKEFLHKEQEYQSEIEKEKQRRIEEIKKQKKLKQEIIKAEEKKAEEVKKKRIAEKRRKTEIEKMTPEQRLQAEFEGPSLTENRVVEIFNKLDELPDEDQKKIAGALKEYWTAKGKWGKKQCSKKQMIKVKKIKLILGEV